MSPARKREAVSLLQAQLDMSQRRACRVLAQARSTQRRQARPKDDEVMLVKRMRELVSQRSRFGYRRIAALLRREGWLANNKRIHRLWRQEGLKVPRKPKRKRAIGSSQQACHAHRAERKNHVWTWDFVFDRARSGSTLKWLSIIDEHTRECLALKVARGITSEDVIDTLAELFAMHGVPAHIRSDNGPEFIAKAIREWTTQLGIGMLYIEPGSPWQNGYAESFHSRLRDEFLRMEEFENLAAARKLTAAWKEDYNHHRPHGSLGYVTPAEFAARCAASASATPTLQQHSSLTQLIPS